MSYLPYMKSIARTAALFTAFFTPVFASAASISLGFSFGSGGGSCVGSDIGCIAQTFLNIINGVLVPLLFALAFIVFLYGVAKAYIFSIGNEEEVSKGHKLILWGIIGFVVMLSLWGLVNIVSNTFGLAGSYAPLPPTSY